LTKIPYSGKENTREYVNNFLKCGLQKYSAKGKEDNTRNRRRKENK